MKLGKKLEFGTGFELEHKSLLLMVCGTLGANTMSLNLNGIASMASLKLGSGTSKSFQLGCFQFVPEAMQWQQYYAFHVGVLGEHHVPEPVGRRSMMSLSPLHWLTAKEIIWAML